MCISQSYYINENKLNNTRLSEIIILYIHMEPIMNYDVNKFVDGVEKIICAIQSCETIEQLECTKTWYTNYLNRRKQFLEGKEFNLVVRGAYEYIDFMSLFDRYYITAKNKLMVYDN